MELCDTKQIALVFHPDDNDIVNSFAHSHKDQLKDRCQHSVRKTKNETPHPDNINLRQNIRWESGDQPLFLMGCGNYL